MPVRALEDYLKKNSLIHENENSSILSGTKIGIEVAHWLHELIQIEEPFQVAMGGLPLTIENAVQKYLIDLK